MRKIFILITSLILCMSVNAQFTGVGIRAGFTLSTINDYIEAKVKPGFHVGGVVNYDFNDYFYLQGGLLLAGKGCKTDYKTDFYKVKETFNSYYLQIPILASVRIPIMDEEAAILLNLGPAINIGLFGKTQTDTTYTTIFNQSIHSSNNEYDTFNSQNGFGRFDISAMMGVGFEWRNFSFNFNYDYGFIILNDDRTFKGTNMAFMFTLGYTFKLND